MACGHVLTSGLVDGHGHIGDVVDIIEELKSAEGVTYSRWRKAEEFEKYARSPPSSSNRAK